MHTCSFFILHISFLTSHFSMPWQECHQPSYVTVFFFIFDSFSFSSCIFGLGPIGPVIFLSRPRIHFPFFTSHFSLFIFHFTLFIFRSSFFMYTFHFSFLIFFHDESKSFYLCSIPFHLIPYRTVKTAT